MNDVKNPSSENDTDVELIGIFAKMVKVKIFERRFKLELWRRIWIFNFKLFQKLEAKSWNNLERAKPHYAG